MEPMTLGSAPSSPASPGHNPNFLPAFLMGDSQTPTNSSSVSPGRNRSSGNVQKLSTNTSSRNLHHKVLNQSILDTPTPHPFGTQKYGPPKQGLFDAIENKTKTPLMNSTTVSCNDSPGFSRNFSKIDDSVSSARNLFNDSLRPNHEKCIDTEWVTVFGFPPSSAGVVLAALSSCGHVLEKRMPTQGNWMQLRFGSVGEVGRALTLDRRCINSSTMIGVHLYYPRENKENESGVFTPPPIRARPLGQTIISPTNPNSVLSPENMPQKSTGLVSKAIDYVFGW